MTYVTKKITRHPESKTTIGQILASCSVTPRPNTTSVTSVIIDSRVTDHFFCNWDLFSSYTEYQHEFETGSGQRIIAHRYGNVVLRICDVSGNVNALTVTNVSSAHELGHNHFSTILLAKKSFEVFLRKLDRPSELYFEGEVVGLADIIENQYFVRLAEDPESATINMVASSSIKTLHARLAHVSYKAIVQLASMALGIQLKGHLAEEICGGCMVGKQQRKLSRKPMALATEFLELLHSDLGGPLLSTKYEYIFYISFYNDATGTYYVKSLRHKSQAFDKFLKFVTWAQTQSGNKLKRYHTDFGREFYNQSFKKWCEGNGVQWEPNVPYCPDQNGKAEILNYSLMSSVRINLFTMKLLKSLWFEILNTVAYLKNRSQGSDGITSFEKLKEDKPDLRHLRIFGSRAWVHIPKKKRRKLDKRFWQGIFVGYEGKNQYRIYNPRTGTVNVYRDVKIDEKNLYDMSSVSQWELANDDLSPNDDLLFADPNKFDEDTNKSLQRNTPSSDFLSKKTTSSGNQDLVGDNQEQSTKRGRE